LVWALLPGGSWSAQLAPVQCGPIGSALPVFGNFFYP